MKRNLWWVRGSLGAGLLTALAFTFGCPQPPDDGGDDGGDDNGGNGGDVEEPARFDLPTRSTNILLTSDDKLLIVANRESNSLSVIRVRDDDGNDVSEKLVELAVGNEPRFLAITPDDRTVFVSNTGSGTISVISLGSEKSGTQLLKSPASVVAEIPVGTEPRGLAITPNGTRLFVANHTNATVSVIDVATRSVIRNIPLPGFPQAIAITNDGDEDDTDETIFVTEYYAKLISGGSGEAHDDGKEAFVDAILTGNLDATPKRITLSPVSSGFTADRKNFCKLLNPASAFDTFCPDVTIVDATAAAIAQDPQDTFPNQLHAALIRQGRLFVPNTGAQPEPPVKFNVNVQALVHVVDTNTLTEIADEHVNLNNQIKAETQPDEATANTVLTRLFAADTTAVDADKGGDTFLFVSRGGNYAMRATLGADGVLDLGAPDIVRFQTGNIPSGVVISSDGRRAYTNNEVNISVTAINLEDNSVLARDIPSGEPPFPGEFAHGVLVGKLCFFTSLGIPDDGVFGTPIREIEPLASRNKASDNGWSSCSSCHPDGLADGVTWIFPTGPRQTLPLDAFFAKDNPADQRVSNWNGVRSSITDFNNNSRNVQGGKGFAGDPPNPNVFNHGLSQGVSDALDAQSLWVQTVRAPILPQEAPANVIADGRASFETNCASCHGGAKWTKSQILYADNPAFDKDPAAGGVPRDPGVANAAAQIVSYTVGALTLTYLHPVGTFNPLSPIEQRADATLALGGIGFNVPSLLGTRYHAPYFHDGSAQSFEEVFARHALGAGTIATTLNAAERDSLRSFIETIDGSTLPFISDTDVFKAAIGG